MVSFLKVIIYYGRSKEQVESFLAEREEMKKKHKEEQSCFYYKNHCGYGCEYCSPTYEQEEANNIDIIRYNGDYVPQIRYDYDIKDSLYSYSELEKMLNDYMKDKLYGKVHYVSKLLCEINKEDTIFYTSC
jgi:hypothetical protein